MPELEGEWGRGLGGVCYNPYVISGFVCGSLRLFADLEGFSIWQGGNENADEKRVSRRQILMSGRRDLNSRPLLPKQESIDTKAYITNRLRSAFQIRMLCSVC